MTTSQFLAQIIGPAYFVVGLAVLLRGDKMKKIYDGAFKSEYAMFMGGMASLVIGLLIVHTHNIWEGDWRVLITLLGWAAVIKGAFILLVPDAFNSWAKKFIAGMNFQMMGCGVLVFGGLLTYFGL